jgi:hypothetical protein
VPDNSVCPRKWDSVLVETTERRTLIRTDPVRNRSLFLSNVGAVKRLSRRNVPFLLARSSTVAAPPAIVTRACLRDTDGKGTQIGREVAREPGRDGRAHEPCVSEDLIVVKINPAATTPRLGFVT